MMGAIPPIEIGPGEVMAAFFSAALLLAGIVALMWLFLRRRQCKKQLKRP